VGEGREEREQGGVKGGSGKRDERMKENERRTVRKEGE